MRIHLSECGYSIPCLISQDGACVGHRRTYWAQRESIQHNPYRMCVAARDKTMLTNIITEMDCNMLIKTQSYCQFNYNWRQLSVRN